MGSVFLTCLIYLTLMTSKRPRLHFPPLSPFLYSQTLGAGEVRVGSILLTAGCLCRSQVTLPGPQLAEQISSPPAVPVFLWEAPSDAVSSPKGGRELLSSSVGHRSPGARAGGKQRGAADRASSSSSQSPRLECGTKRGHVG